MAEIKVTLGERGSAYLTLSPTEIRHSVALDQLDEANMIPALGAIVLDFDYFGRLAGIEIGGSADSVLPPALIEAAEDGQG